MIKVWNVILKLHGIDENNSEKGVIKGDIFWFTVKSFYKNTKLKRYLPLFLLLAVYSCKKESSNIGLD